MKRENERQIKKNLSKILGVLVLCLIMPLLFQFLQRRKKQRNLSSKRKCSKQRE